MRKMIEKIPKPLLSSIIYMLIVFFQSGINLLTTPLFSRVLSTKEFGITTAYNSWFNIVSIFITLNLSSGVFNNALIDFKNEKDKMTSSFFSIGIMNSFIAFLLYFLFRDSINSIMELPPILISFMIIQSLLTSAWSFFLSKEKFDYKFIKPLIITLITFLSNPICGYLSIQLFPSDKAVAKIIGCYLPSLIIYFGLMIYILKKGKCFSNKKFWKYALAFNIPLIPHYLSGILLASSDRIMIQKLINFETAGIYGIAYQLSLVVQGVFTGINSALIPYTYKNLSKNEKEPIRNYVNIMLVVVFFVCVLVSLFGPEIIMILATKDYYSAMYVIPPVVLGLYFSFVASLFGNIEFYFKKTKFVTFATCVGAIINIILNLIFIPKYGFISAGYTTLIGYFVIMILHYLYLKYIGMASIYNLKFIVILSIMCISLIIGIVFLYKYIIARILIFLFILFIIFLKKKSFITNIKKIKGD